MEEEILPSLLELVHTYQISPSLIQIEITETIEEKDCDVLLTLSHQLRQAGFTIALDDFGTKYTNLSILTHMDFDVLKLDRSLIQTLCFRASNQTIIKHVIQMCKELPVEVIAEGIENEEQAALLTSMGCPSAQGYLFGAPMPISEFFESRFMPAETRFQNLAIEKGGMVRLCICIVRHPSFSNSLQNPFIYHKIGPICRSRRQCVTSLVLRMSIMSFYPNKRNLMRFFRLQ